MNYRALVRVKLYNKIFFIPDQVNGIHRFLKIFISISFIIGLLLFSIRPAFSQQNVSLDWKMHDAGKVRQVITNMGTLWKAQTDYPGLIYAEFPPNSSEEHIGEAGFLIGDITAKGDTLVSVSDSWNSPNEFYPTGASWDTVWVATHGDTLDIPYWKNYTPVSDQDFIAHYNDYGEASLRLPNHNPLYLDVIETSYAWTSPPLDEMIIYTYRIIPQKFDLDDAYIEFFMDANVGYRSQGWDFALDDVSHYDEEGHMGIGLDTPGGVDGMAKSPIGTRLYPPEDVPEDSLKWTFNWYPGQGQGGPPSRDPQRFEDMSSGVVMNDQQRAVGSQYMVSFGPVSVAKGDTLVFRMAEIMGDGEKGMYDNAKLADYIINKHYKVPSPPPDPQVKVSTNNRKVTINWEPQPGEMNPENYQDPNRADSVKEPFEGYRVYKSTQSPTGPWTLLAEYDVAGDSFGANTGLKHEYTDTGLLNNINYYYTVTAFSKRDSVLNWPSQESSINSNAMTATPGTAPPSDVGEVAVVPNPYRGDVNYNATNPPWEKPAGTRDRWLEQDRRIQFINLPQTSQIKIFTLSGNLVQTINHIDAQQGYEDWNLTSSVGQAVSSGIYLFTVKNKKTGKVQTGKFVIIK